MAVNPSAERLRALQAQQPEQPGPPEAPGQPSGLGRLAALGAERAQRAGRPAEVAGLDIGKFLPGPLAGIFGSTANPDAPANVRRAEELAAEQRARSELTQLTVNADIAASGINVAQLDPARLAALQTQLAVNPEAGQKTLNEIEAAQEVNFSPREIAKGAIEADRASVEFRIAQQQEAAGKISANMDILNRQRALGIGMDPERLISTSDMLFDDRRRDMAPFRDQLANFDQLQSIISTESGPASMAVLFKFIKSMDDSVVRESEGRLLSSSSGPVRQLVNLFNQVQGGGLFDQTTRDEINQAATQIAEATFSTAKQINDDHDSRAARFAEQFQTPALAELSAGVGFNPARQFEAVKVTPRNPVDEREVVTVDSAP